MPEFEHPYLVGAHQRGALVDCNLLMVLLVGMLGDGEVEKFKRTQAYTSDDALGVDSILRKFGWICTTPHVLAEVSNLLDWFHGKKRSKVLQFLTAYVRTVSEHHQPANELVDNSIFCKLGLTDAGLMDVAHTNNLVLVTADLPLYHYSSELGVEAINFNHIREAWLV